MLASARPHLPRPARRGVPAPWPAHPLRLMMGLEAPHGRTNAPAPGSSRRACPARIAVAIRDVARPREE